MKQVKGFTLIELIAVIVILSILAVTAVPQFLDMRTDARNAVAGGIGGALGSATAMNYAKGVTNGAAGAATTVTSCTDATSGVGARANLLIPGATQGTTDIVVNGKTFVIAGTSTAIASGASATCTIRASESGASVQTFTMTGCAGLTCS